MRVAASAPGDIVQLSSPFQPAPLLAHFAGEGFRVWCAPDGERFRTCISKS